MSREMTGRLMFNILISISLGLWFKETQTVVRHIFLMAGGAA